MINGGSRSIQDETETVETLVPRETRDRLISVACGPQHDSSTLVSKIFLLRLHLSQLKDML